MKEVLRQCVSCLKSKDRSMMHKITYSKKDGKLYLDPNLKIFGRSLYVCKSKECIMLCKKRKKIEKRFSNADSENISEIINKLS